RARARIGPPERELPGDRVLGEERDAAARPGPDAVAVDIERLHAIARQAVERRERPAEPAVGTEPREPPVRGARPEGPARARYDAEDPVRGEAARGPDQLREGTRGRIGEDYPTERRGREPPLPRREAHDLVRVDVVLDEEPRREGRPGRRRREQCRVKRGERRAPPDPDRPAPRPLDRHQPAPPAVALRKMRRSSASENLARYASSDSRRALRSEAASLEGETTPGRSDSRARRAQAGTSVQRSVSYALRPTQLRSPDRTCRQ